MSLLKCENLSFAYDGVTVVRDLNFTVEEGNYLCIVGENGAGKSTLIKGLLRLKKPSAGKVEMGEGLKATEIGYLPQQTQIQKDFPASVQEVVLSGCLNRMGLRPFYTRTEKERARKNMKALEILDLQDQCYRDLSGGQQQRVLLARAMCAAQKLILLDEPVSGLDPVATRSLYTQIEQINETTGLTVIMVSHDIHAAVRYASHILHLGQEGQLFFGTQNEYRHSAIYHEFLGDRAAPMWKHDFPNRVGRAASPEEAEPTETESRVKIDTGKKSFKKHLAAKSGKRPANAEKTARNGKPENPSEAEKTARRIEPENPSEAEETARHIEPENPSEAENNNKTGGMGKSAGAENNTKTGGAEDPSEAEETARRIEPENPSKAEKINKIGGMEKSAGAENNTKTGGAEDPS